MTLWFMGFGTDENDGEPFTIGEGSAAVTVKAIPGLKYTLWRAAVAVADARHFWNI